MGGIFIKRLVINKNKIIIFLSWCIFEAYTLLSLFITKNLSVKIFTNNHLLNAFYWLSPTFSVIQTGNFLVTWGGIISSIIGSILPLGNRTIKTHLLFLIKLNFSFIITSIFTTYLFEEIYFSSVIPFSIQILYHSFQMFFGTFLFLTYWSFVGFGLKLILNKGLIVAIICFFEQVFEHYFIFIYKPELELYLPYALSREIIIRNYPFWDSTSWASVNNTVAYANNSLILNNHFEPLKVSNLWIIAILLGYLIIIFIRPFFQLIKKKSSKAEVLDNAN